ncbi:glycoside hydrolase family 113 [Alicyclobacillus mali (ex Roth et al. 2021)]|uniref:glycoside hydrolase family 113 n=1 Tax=Alicyclobacillus mali (ex Roth et al. 2021) TaxID=1123961 RepID=UPI00082A1E84|nr:1,4-beta-xylanase [Alicyclobacillus mali (ex Roth et al. 2021)]
MGRIESAFDLGFIRGMTFGFVGQHGTWGTDEARASMRALAEQPFNWVTLAFAGLMEHPADPAIAYGPPVTVSDEEIASMAELAHALGLKVCLKPTVNCRDGTWRGEIRFEKEHGPDLESWEAWFGSYSDMMAHYARLAKRTGCEMFCVGCEMTTAEPHEAMWRETIASVRTEYDGLVTYNCNHGREEHVRFWDAVDLISSSAYYPIDRWRDRVPVLREVAEAHEKPLFFMEVGCPSRSGSGACPWDYRHPGAVCLDEQARFYEAMFAAMPDEPWFKGYMLWEWPWKLYPREAASEDGSYCIYGKPAEAVVARAFSAIANG